MSRNMGLGSKPDRCSIPARAWLISIPVSLLMWAGIFHMVGWI